MTVRDSKVVSRKQEGEREQIVQRQTLADRQSSGVRPAKHRYYARQLKVSPELMGLLNGLPKK